MKNKLIYLFSPRTAQDFLNSAELSAICKFLKSKVEIFSKKYIDKRSLKKLISESEVIDLESDAIPFQHNFDFKVEHSGHVNNIEY
jgi:hypothetical protein